jgi:hypothetical protein
MKKCGLIVAFLIALVAIDMQAMEKKPQPFISVKQAAQAIDRAYTLKFRALVNEYVRKFKMNAPAAEFEKLKDKLLKAYNELMEDSRIIDERLAVTKPEIVNNFQVDQAFELLKEKKDTDVLKLKQAKEAYEKRNPGVKIPLEFIIRSDRTAMDFTRAKKEAGQINQKLVAVRDAGKTFSKQQCDELNAVAQIAIF